MAAIREMGNEYDLYIVGRGEGVKSPLLKGLSDWESNQELGTIGDVLASSCFSSQASILAVRQSSAFAASFMSRPVGCGDNDRSHYQTFMRRTRRVEETEEEDDG